MKAKQAWSFSAPLEDVDVARILREAGPDARAVRFTIDGKWYVAINRDWLREQGWIGRGPDDVIDWNSGVVEEPAYVNDNDRSGWYRVYRKGDYVDGEVLVTCSSIQARWAITRDPAWAKNFLDLVETTVEVF